MKPILFNTEMVKAILDGRKTETRRVVDKDIVYGFDIEVDGSVIAYINQDTGDSFNAHEICRYRPGDILYVRETWADLRGMGFGNDPHTNKPWDFTYRADIKPGSDSDRTRMEFGVKWRPSIHMPREAARIFLRVTDVMVERVQEITEEGAHKEGLQNYYGKRIPYESNIIRFADYWDEVYSARGYGWDTNPWVWKISFERIDKPNDT